MPIDWPFPLPLDLTEHEIDKAAGTLYNSRAAKITTPEGSPNSMGLWVPTLREWPEEWPKELEGGPDTIKRKCITGAHAYRLVRAANAGGDSPPDCQTIIQNILKERDANWNGMGLLFPMD